MELNAKSSSQGQIKPEAKRLQEVILKPSDLLLFESGTRNVQEPHQHHDVQICHVVHSSFTQNDDGACGVQAPPACSARHLNVLTCPEHKRDVDILLCCSALIHHQRE